MRPIVTRMNGDVTVMSQERSAVERRFAACTLRCIPARAQPCGVRTPWMGYNFITKSANNTQDLLHSRHLEFGFPASSRVEIVRIAYGKVAWGY
jgi:hypothetical protein